MSIVETSELCKVYGKGETAVHALRNVAFQAEQGEFVAVTGPSGSGKSTLLHLLGGVDIPTSGTVQIEGQDIYHKREKELAAFRRRRIGFVFQFYNLIPLLTAEENIRVPLMLDSQRIDESFLKELLDILGLTERRNHLPSQLSGGQQQRVAIGRAIVHKPSLVLADEPTGNLDTQNGREVLALLKSSVRKFGQTLILITHDPSVAAQADRVVMMQDGCIVGGGKLK
ncbi:MAG: ABC transporter ATP-binding protein [Sporolactobacillus sp.]